MNLQELIDRQEIIDRLNRYAELIDTGRPREVPAELFTADMIEDHGEGLPVHESPAQLADFLERATEPFDSCMHFITNYQITVHGDRASSRTNYLAIHWVKGGEQPGRRAAEWISAGIYVDAWRRTADGWRIERRHRENVGASSVAVGERPRHLLDMADRPADS